MAHQPAQHGAAVNKGHGFQIESTPAEMIEFTTDLFSAGGGFPQPGLILEQNGRFVRSKLLEIACKCIQHSQGNPGSQILITGHGTKSDPGVTHIRAQLIHALLSGADAFWSPWAIQTVTDPDTDAVLTWASWMWSWDCERPLVGRPDAVQRFKNGFIKDIQPNLPGFAPIAANNAVDLDFWRATFELYCEAMALMLAIPRATLKNQQAGLPFLPLPAGTTVSRVGCANHFPRKNVKLQKNQVYESLGDHRVEALFFPINPPAHLACHPAVGTCVPKSCSVYPRGSFRYFFVRPAPLPVERPLRVCLKLTYEDPEGKERAFPDQMHYKVRHSDGTLDPKLYQTLEGGILKFEVPRTKADFTIHFENQAMAPVYIPQYIAVEPWGAAQNESTLIGPDAERLAGEEFRMFRLPDNWVLGQADYDTTKAPHFNGATRLFDNLNNVDRIGSLDAPEILKLRPTWQYIRHEYYDRWIGKKQYRGARIQIPPVLIEGYNTTPANAAFIDPPANNTNPDTQANWLIGDSPQKQCIAIPWIIQRTFTAPNTYTAANKPDANIHLRFALKDSSGANKKPFIESTEAKRDVHGRQLRHGIAWLLSGDARLGPNPKRLQFYDLPEIWTSRNYFARRDAITGPPASPMVADFFQNVANTVTSKEKPLIFDLDDMVLTDQNVDPIDFSVGANWTMGTAPNAWRDGDRVTLFHHTFANPGGGGARTTPTAPAAGRAQKPSKIKVYSPIGLYNPDDYVDAGPPAVQSRLSPFYSDIAMPVNYIADHPDWTRIVLARGSVHDVFEKRVAGNHATVGHANRAIGARAAVRWVDGTTGPNGAAVGAAHPAPGLTAANAHPCFQIQPFFRQEFFEFNSQPAGNGAYDEWSAPVAPGAAHLFQNARFDMVMLRCCDVDGENEVAVVLKYHRFNFGFDEFNNSLGDAAHGSLAPPIPGGADSSNYGWDSVYQGMTGPQRVNERPKWVSNFLKNCALRWSGEDGVNGDRTWVLPRGSNPPNDPKLKALIITFVQKLDDPQAHFRVRTIGERGTSSMTASTGLGKLRVAAGRDTTGEASDRGFAGAHETGHTGGQPDEYVSSARADGQDGFGSNHIPAGPFVLDGRAMMNFNREVRARYFWQVAEWMRTLPGMGAVDLKIEHGGDESNYMLPHYQHTATRPGRNYVFWPVRSKLRQAAPGASMYDAYLYILGEDRYSTRVLPGLLRGRGRVDGILVVLLKLAFDFQGWCDDDDEREYIFQQINSRLDSELNRKVVASFTIPGGPPQFQRCLIHFSIRFSNAAGNNEHMLTTVVPTAYMNPGPPKVRAASNWNPGADPRALTVVHAPNAGAADASDTNHVIDVTYLRAIEALGMNTAGKTVAGSYRNPNSYAQFVTAAVPGIAPTIKRR